MSCFDLLSVLSSYIWFDLEPGLAGRQSAQAKHDLDPCRSGSTITSRMREVFSGALIR